ncbi:MAG: hypothetical protein GF344_06995 [Chitinivibrionales bacterium]|nr:hypothetical protein [Chitinivibrionales bacterium]
MCPASDGIRNGEAKTWSGKTVFLSVTANFILRSTKNIQYVHDNNPYSYNSGKVKESLEKEASTETVFLSRRTKLLRYGSLTIGIVGTGVGAYLMSRYSSIDDDLAAANPITTCKDKYAKMQNDRDTAKKGGVAGLIVGGLVFLGFRVSFAF